MDFSKNKLKITYFEITGLERRILLRVFFGLELSSPQSRWTPAIIFNKMAEWANRET